MFEHGEHPADEVLADFAEDPESLADSRVIARHVASCERCSGRLAKMREFATSMHDDETWWLVAQIEGGLSQTLDEFTALRDAEDAEARRMLAPFLESAYRFEYANVVHKRRFQTGGVVRLLCEASRYQCDRDPEFARTLADHARAIAESLPDDYYPANAVYELRGSAWNDYAEACRLLSDFKNGFEGLRSARRAYRHLADPEHHLAVMDLRESVLLWEQQRYDDALRLVRSAAAVFARRRATDRYLEAREVEALILHRKGDVPAAKQTYEAAFELARTIGDPEMEARAARNLGIVHRDTGDIGTASKHFLHALQLYEALDQPARVTHTRWSIAKLALAAGNASEAERRLTEAVVSLEALGMRSDIWHAQLDLVEAKLILGKLDEVEKMGEALLAYFRSAEMLTSAMTAAAYLAEAAHARTLTRRDIEHVRRFLLEAERHPDRPFAPPPPDDGGS